MNHKTSGLLVFISLVMLSASPGAAYDPNVAGIVNPAVEVAVRSIVNDAPIADAGVNFGMCDNMHVADGRTDRGGTVQLGYWRPGPSTRIQCYIWNITVTAPGFAEQRERRESGERTQRFTIYLKPLGVESRGRGHEGGRSQGDEGGGSRGYRAPEDRPRWSDHQPRDRPWFAGDGSYLYLPVRYRSEKEYLIVEDRTGPMPVTDFDETHSARITISRYGGGKHGMFAAFPGFSCGLTHHGFDIPEDVARERRRVTWRGNIGEHANRGDCPRLSYEIVGEPELVNGRMEFLVRGVTIYGE